MRNRLARFIILCFILSFIGPIFFITLVYWLITGDTDKISDIFDKTTDYIFGLE